MKDLAALSVERLREAGVRLEPGLVDAEIQSVQRRFRFQFCASHRRLLSLVLPTGSADSRSNGWPDWRSGSEQDLRNRLSWPVEGVILHVVNGGFWPASWGARPAGAADAEAKARMMLDGVPRMVPIFGHRYLPSEPAPENPPVFSIYQTDVIYYGDDLLDYVAREFQGAPLLPLPTGDQRRTPFWSDLAEGAEALDL